MGLPEKLWDALNDKVERMAETMKNQQVRIEDLTMRVVRLETALEIALASRSAKAASRSITKKPE